MFDLKRFRKEKGLRQATLAEEIGIVRTRLSRVENMRDELTYGSVYLIVTKDYKMVRRIHRLWSKACCKDSLCEGRWTKSRFVTQG